jgi:hypothetical protein
VVGLALFIAGLAAPRLVPGTRSTFGPATARLGGTLAVAGALTLLRRKGATGRGAPRPGFRAEPQARGKSRAATWWRAAVGAFIALDLLLSGWSLVPTVDRSLYRGHTAAAAVLHESRPVRVYWPADPTHRNREYDAEQRVKFSYLTFNSFGPRDVAYWWDVREAQLPNVGILDVVPSANNFDPLLVGRTAGLLEAAVETPAILRVMGVTHVFSDRPWPGGEPAGDGRSEVAGLYRLPDALGRAWVVPAARQVSSDKMLAALTDPAFDPTAEALLEHPVSSIERPASSIQYQVTLRDTPNRVTIRAILDAPGYLVVADTWYPGWQATVDGVPTEVLRANYAFRAVWLEAGKHEVEMVYRPTLVLIGGVVSLATLMSLVAGLLLTRRPEARA